MTDTVISLSSALSSSDMRYQCVLCHTTMKCKRSMFLVYFLLSRLLFALSLLKLNKLGA